MFVHPFFTPVVSLIAGILVLIFPTILNYIVAFYLIATGKAKEAEPYLLLAGEDAGVLAAFE